MSNMKKLCFMLLAIVACAPSMASANAASAFFFLPPSPVLNPSDSCASTVSSSRVCTDKTGTTTTAGTPPVTTCTVTCNRYGTQYYHSEIAYTDQQVFKGRWYASCGKKPDGVNFDIRYRDLTGRMAFKATLSTDLFGNAVGGAPVILDGRVTKIGPEVSPEATTVRNVMDAALSDTNIWACQTPPGFVGSSPLLPFDSGEFGNPWCPPGCLPPPTSQAYRYKIEFVRPGCGSPAAADVNCNIPEGYYTVSMNLSGLDPRKAPAGPPTLINTRAMGGPVAGGIGLAPPWGLGYELWATDEWKNVPPLPPPPGPGTIDEQPKCSGTCPNTYNDHPYVWPFVTGEEIRLETTAPELFMMGSVKLESGRDSAGNAIFTDFDSNGGIPRLVSGYDAPVGTPPFSFIQAYNPSAIIADAAGNANYALGNSPATAPFNANNIAFPRNTMHSEAIEVPKFTVGNIRPQNVAMGPNTFLPIVNALRAGYTPYTIHQGMAGNQCALLKAGRKMLADGAAATSRTSQTLIYIGGCPSNWGAATKFNTFDVNWFASSNVLGGFKPGDMDPISLALRAMNTPRTTNLQTATDQCFADVGSTANSFVVITSPSCPGLAAAATNTAVGSNSTFGCRGACKLGAGGDSTSDCAAKVLQCLSGPARQVN